MHKSNENQSTKRKQQASFNLSNKQQKQIANNHVALSGEIYPLT